MSIVYPLALPATLPAKVTLQADDVVAVSTSPFTGAQEVFAHAGAFWSATVEYPTMRRDKAEPILAALLALRGRYGTFLLGDPLGSSPRGSASGAPLVDGAQAARGRTLATRGWTASASGVLLAGDYVQLGTGNQQRLHKVLTDVTADGLGKAVLDIWPPLREGPADGAAVSVAACQGVFRLADNKRPWSEVAPDRYQVSFQAMEAI